MKRLLSKAIKLYYQRIRIFRLNVLSTAGNVIGNPIKIQPVLLAGDGEMRFGSMVNIGVINSPSFYSGYCYIEARDSKAKVTIGNSVAINNNFCIICDKTFVTIEDNVLIGFNVAIIDSDFHPIDPANRLGSNYDTAPVIISKNVFIGSNVTILKGVTIGENTIIGSGSVVTKSFGSNLIIGGNPAQVIKQIEIH